MLKIVLMWICGVWRPAFGLDAARGVLRWARGDVGMLEFTFYLYFGPIVACSLLTLLMTIYDR